jgi:hypothetical protein
VLDDYSQYDGATASPHWTSTAYPEVTNLAEIVFIGIGYASDFGKTEQARVRLVRAGSGLGAYAPPDATFVFGNGFE